MRLTSRRFRLEVPWLLIHSCLPRAQRMAEYRTCQADHRAVDLLQEIGLYYALHPLSMKIFPVNSIWDLRCQEPPSDGLRRVQ